MTQPQADLTEVREWISRNAAPLDSLEPLGAAVAEATVVGMGESTRAGQQVMETGHRVLRYLVEHKGFRALALQDDETVLEPLNEYVQSGAGDPKSLMADLWKPWQNTALLEVVEWIRSYNAGHPDDPVGLYGLTPRAARLADYDAVLSHLRRHAPERLPQLQAHYDVIRTAHEIGEHVQQARGVHPGRPFAAHARDARDLLAAVTDTDDQVTASADRIVDFHANSIAGGYDFDASAGHAADAVLALRERTGHKILYWEGLAHTANAGQLNLGAMGASLRSVGARLRQHLGAGYFSMAIGFQYGEIHLGEQVPAPATDFVDHVLGEAVTGDYLLDLRAPRSEAVARWLAGPHKLRIIAGIYLPAEDEKHFIQTGALDEWFDLLIRVGRITPTTVLA